MTIAACALFPIVSHDMIMPYLQAPAGVMEPLTHGNMSIMLIMLGSFLVLPPLYRFIPRKEIQVSSYLAGANFQNGNSQFKGAIGRSMGVEMRNYYLSSILNENTLALVGRACCAGLILVMVWMGVSYRGGVELPLTLSQAPAQSLDPMLRLALFAAFILGAPVLGCLLAGI